MQIIIYEDEGYRNFHPLTWTRPVYLLRCGIYLLLDKILHWFRDGQVSLLCRDYIAPLVQEYFPQIPVNTIPTGPLLFINGRVLFTEELHHRVSRLKTDHMLTIRDIPAAILLSEKKADKIKKQLTYPICNEIFQDITAESIDEILFQYPWEIIHQNSEQISQDFDLLVNQSFNNTRINPDLKIVNPGRVYIGKNTVINPGVIIDACEGPVYIGERVKIQPNVSITGPVFIGNNCLVKSGTSLSMSSIGEVSKIGGEITESIIHSYSNKQHNGYLGNSYLGSWVNLGAGTNTSDLKNNYTPVKAFINGKYVNTGSLHLGSIIGDHSRAGINTMLNSGTIAGVSCNIFGAGFPPKWIPSFLWGGTDKFSEYDFEKSLQTATVVMARRNIPLTDTYQSILQFIYNQTSQARQDFLRNKD